jgi:LacI family transcriptional regulator
MRNQTNSGLKRSAATLRDVAEMAQVSTSTASRILHGGAIRVSDDTRARVVQAAESLRYRPNTLARSLRTKVTRTVGFLIPDIQNPVYAQMIAGAEEAAQAQGYALLLMNSSSGERRRAFIELLVEDRLDGLIIADATIDDQWIHKLQASGRTFVLVNRRARGNAPYVVLDDQGGSALAIQHLLDLGHRTIAYLAGPPGVETAEQRFEGALKRCQEAGLPLPPTRVASCGFNGEGVAAAVDRFFSETPEITGIATANIVIAFAAVQRLEARGLRIPSDVSVVGFHETPMATYVSPGVTTVEMPLMELGRRAMLNLLDQIAGIPVRNEVITDPKPRIVQRHSTGTPRTS